MDMVVIFLLPSSHFGVVLTYVLLFCFGTKPDMKEWLSKT